MKHHLKLSLPFVFRVFSFFAIVIVAWSCNKSKNETDSKLQESSDNRSVDSTIVKKNIVFFGNSLTAGYGLDDSSLAFAGLIQKRLDSLGYAYRVINAGVSGETTAGGNSRIDWLLKQPVDIFVLELGGNDGLRGISLADTRSNLQQILDKVKAKYPEAELVLAGMQIPPNIGLAYTKEFKQLYIELAKENDIAFIPFLLEGVGGEPSLNLPDGIHPNEEGHRIVANTVWATLQPLLEH
ncbi:acyl-CoA thioesterase-1 [Dyadobacter jejuensis]|uniref:Acyl-CoA thioesterase-1 n=1 Tax=Dyadobacter jejuensis TaxID=1082580 RepID=A0A316AM26_9BACT|nr:arylesterase [Dyadobacter jejuensis]PWJ58835.1 acyl-CoA thioesterase-1 [Dyadobacter jejuensis]